METWQALAPAAFSQIPEPNKFFSELGMQAHQQWMNLWPQMVDPDEPGEDFFHKAGRITAAKMRAEEIVRADLLTPPADSQEQDEDLAAPDPLAEVYQALQEYLDEE